MVVNTVRVTRPSRSSPRSVSVSILCEMPPTMRLISLKRRGPSPSSIMTNTLHLSPTRARIEATPRQSLSRCGWGGRTGTFLCSGFNGVLGFQKCAFLRGLWTVTHIVSVTNLYHEGAAMKLLHIDSSVLGAHSVSRQVSAAIVDRLRKATPGLEIVYRDLSSTPLAHLSGSHLAAAQGAAPEAALQQDLAVGQAVLDEFLAADIVVLGAPMYNFTIPSQLKAWIDRILVAGKTFRYGASGPEGLAGSKRVLVAISRGGLYGAGMPAAALEHVESYLRGVFGFIGVTNLEIVVAEGLQIGPEQREKAMRGALQAVTELSPVTRLRAA